MNDLEECFTHYEKNNEGVISDALFRNILQNFGFQNLNIVRYYWRHAAASHDLLQRSRSEEQVEREKFLRGEESTLDQCGNAFRVEHSMNLVQLDTPKYGELVRTQLPSTSAAQSSRPPTM